MGRRSQAGKRGNCQRSARTSASGAGQQTDIAEPESIEAEEQLELFGAEASEDVDAEASIGNVGLGSDNILGVDHGDRDIETMTAADLVACLDLFMQEQAAEIMLQGKRSCVRPCFLAAGRPWDSIAQSGCILKSSTVCLTQLLTNSAVSIMTCTSQRNTFVQTPSMKSNRCWQTAMVSQQQMSRHQSTGIMQSC
ncbi:TPA: hypothetical protein ACH3X2_003783 [Trebouxia sp. C0005]